MAGAEKGSARAEAGTHNNVIGMLVRPFYLVLLHIVLLVRTIVTSIYTFILWPIRSIVPPNSALIKAHLAERNRLISKGKTRVAHYNAESSDGQKSIYAEIQACNIGELVHGIEQRRWSATTVVEVFIAAAIAAHERTNCLTEVNFDVALQRAAELDETFEKTGKILGPLHGVPFSLKDQYSLKGKLSTIGFSEWLKKNPEEQDCAFARIVQSLGAVCIAKTNVPQTMYSFECRNPLWGETSNPHDKAFTSGGSSGGEAALLACGGAAFGYGSDIGGSLRIPTMYCGIYALKTSNGRSWPRAGNIDLGPRPRAVESVAGPMCRSMADLDLLTRVVYEAMTPESSSAESIRERQKRFGVENSSLQPLRPAWLDPFAAASKHNKANSTTSQNKTRAIRIGYYRCDGLTLTSPACMRAIDEAVKALSKVENPIGRGLPALELVEIDPALLQTFKAFKTFSALTSINRQKHLLAHVGQDPLDPTLSISMRSAQSRIIRSAIALVARLYYGDDKLPQVLNGLSGDYAQKYFELESTQDTLRLDFERNIWDRLNLDALIAPVQASPALPNYGTLLIPTLAASTILYNVLGNPVVVVPVTRVDAVIDRHEKPSSKDSVARQAQHAAWTMMRGRETTSKMVTANLYKKYDAARMAGLPVGVQVVTRDFEDEKAVGIARVLDDALKAVSSRHSSSKLSSTA